jgi:hypothetical protein
MDNNPVVCTHEIHHQAGRQDCGSASDNAAKLDYRWHRASPEDTEHRRGQCAFMEQTGRGEDTQGNQKEVAPIRQAKKRSIDPDLKEFIDNVIAPILVKEFLIIDQIEAEVRARLKAARAAQTPRKEKP